MRTVFAVAIAATVIPFAACSVVVAEPDKSSLRVIPPSVPGKLVNVPNARQIVPIVGARSGIAAAPNAAQKTLARAGSYLAGIASAVKQAVANQAASPAEPTAVAAHDVTSPQLVRGPDPATRPAQPVLVAGPVQITRVAQNASPAKISVYTCHLGEDYSLTLKKCVPEAKPWGAGTSVASTASGVTAVRTVARVTKPGARKGSVLAGRIDSSGGRMALGVKAQRK